MRDPATPILDARDADEVYWELVARLPAYTPELTPLAPGSASAILRVLARYADVVIQRLNQTPDKNKLAFLDMLGISLLAPVPARAPLVFTPLPLARDTRIEAGTRAAAKASGASAPLVFETEQAVALAAATLTDVFSVWPDRDGYLDHSTSLAGGRAFVLFRRPLPIPHEFYLAHDVLLAFMGKTTVHIEWELAANGSAPLSIVWEHWDGQVWQPFGATSVDGTAGLTRSGVATLRAICGDSLPRTVANIRSHWVRGRLSEPLPPDSARVPPLVDRLRLRVEVERPLTTGSGGEPAGIAPDAAWTGQTKVDLTKIFYPLSKSPDQDSVFYFASQEALSKPGAQVDVSITRVATPEEESDALGSKYAIDVNNARTQLLAAAKKSASAAVEAAHALEPFLTSFSGTAFQSAIANLQNAVNGLNDPKDTKNIPPVVQALRGLAAVVLLDTSAVWIGFPPIEFGDVAQTRQKIKDARQEIVDAIDAAKGALDALSKIGPVPAAAGGGVATPQLPPPRLVWEYFDGAMWRTLIAPSATDANNLMGSGTLHFTVPDDLQPVEIEGEMLRVVRARLASGSYNRLQMISWLDNDTQQINFFPLIKPRPPALRNLVLGYIFHSPWKDPERCLTSNDFQLEHHSRDAVRAGGFFPPFRPTSDVTPTLYLGFDRPLPNDLIGLYFDLEESTEPPARLIWEVWTGSEWSPVTAQDGTGGLRRPGIVRFLAPETMARREAPIEHVEGEKFITPGPRSAALFSAGAAVVLRKDKAAEIARIQAVEGGNVVLEAPPGADYAGGVLTDAALPRFGVSRDWLRIRMQDPGEPAFPLVKGIYLNAVWAAQHETINGETLGGGDGRLNQTFFFHRFPVLPGEQIEVRELEGARAEVEYPMLRDELFSRRFTDDDLRTVADPRTGKLREVWVRWRGRPHLYSSGPEDRHYVLERARGRIRFGDGRNGMLPPAAGGNIRARRYQSGGGTAANVVAGAVNQMLSGAPAQTVFNPRAAEGGADGEALSAVNWRGPEVTRHRRRSLSARDYEALAREASPGVAAARALAATDPNLRPAPGWVTVIVVPRSVDPRPMPSFELRQVVATYLADRAPASLVPSHITVIAPDYFPVGVAASVTPRDAGQAGMVRDAVREALTRFLHPLTGGPDGRGWPFGRSVFISDLAAILEAVEGVDYIRRLQLLVQDVPAGDSVQVPSHRIVVAGALNIEMTIGVH